MRGNSDIHHLYRFMRTIAVWLAVSLCLGAEPALAHHTSIGSNAGIKIPSLTHGQMQVIDENVSDILALADRQAFQDETFFRLRNFFDVQYLYCGWGLMPGGVADEASPFNECSHAYLSAAQALLLHMRGMQGDQSRVRSLIDKIELQMLMNNASLVLCRYSDEPFNTADVITPRWRNVPFHLPSLLVFASTSLILFSLAFAYLRFLIGPISLRAKAELTIG